MTDRLLYAMMEYEKGSPKRVQHLLKVYEFSRLIGKMEHLDEHTQLILESAAIVHDIGIRLSLEKYNSSNGSYQEVEGPPEAKTLLENLGWPSDVTERVCWLVGHHHTYTNIDGIDYQILVEADFLVNLYEEESAPAVQKSVYHNIFKTEGGKKICALLYPAVLEQ